METIVYGFYQRDADGTVRRAQGYEYALPDNIDLHGEQLVGWPEAFVYWTAETGPAKGYAPVVLRPLP